MKKSFLLLLILSIYQIFYANNLDSSLWNSIGELRIKALSYQEEDIDLYGKYLDSALRLVEEPIDTNIYFRLLRTTNRYHFRLGDYEKSMRYMLEAIKLSESSKNYKRTARSYLYLAQNFYYTNEYDKVRKYTTKSISLIESKGIEDYNLSEHYELLALVYFDNSELDSALHYFALGLGSLEEESADLEMDKARYADNIGQVMEHKGNYKEAANLYSKSLKYHKTTKRTSDIIWTCNRIVQTYISQNKEDSAKKYLEFIHQEMKNSKELITWIKRDVYFTELIYYSLFFNKDSIYKKIEQYDWIAEKDIEERSSANMQEMFAKYELEKKESNLKLAKQKAATLKQENRNQRIVLFILILGISTLLAFIFLIRRYYKQKRKVSLLEIEVKDRKLDELISSQESETLSAMLKGQEKERNRIARDLHDRLGGTLAALKHSLRRPENNVLNEDLEIVDQAVQEVRDISHNLSGGILSRYGLNDAIDQLRRTVERSGGVQFKVFLHPSISKLSQDATLELYRIVQELVSNTLKHAEASEITIQTNIDEGVFNLIYEDNGKGFNLNNVKGGIGLENIKQRVNQIDGTVHWDTSEGRGTIVIVEINNKAK